MRALVLILLLFFAFDVKSQSTRRKLSTSKDLFTQGKYTESLLLANEVLNAEPNQKDALELKISILLQQNQLKDAQLIFEENEPLFKIEEDIDFLLIFHDKLGNFKQVKKLYYATKTRKMKLEYFEIYLNSFYKLNDIDSTLVCANQCIENYNDYSTGYYYKGLCLEQKENYSQASTNFQKAIYFINNKEGNRSNKLRIYKAQARCSYQLSSYATAMEWCNKILIDSPNDFEMNCRKANCFGNKTTIQKHPFSYKSHLRLSPKMF